MLPFFSSVSYFLSLAQRLAQRAHWEDKKSARETPSHLGADLKCVGLVMALGPPGPKALPQTLVWVLGAHQGHLAYPPRSSGSSQSPQVFLHP